jgi:hypothetical protein
VSGAVDGSYLTIACEEGSRYWEATTGKLVNLPAAHVVAVDRAKGRGLVGMENRFILVELPAGKELATVEITGTTTMDLGAGQVVIGTGAGEVHRWQEGEAATRVMGEKLEGPVGVVAISPDGSRSIAGSAAGAIHLYDTRAGSPIAKMVGPPGARMARFSPDGRWVLVAGAGGAAALIEVATAKATPLPGHSAPIHAVSFTMDSRRLATVAGDGTVRIWATSDLSSSSVLRGARQYFADATFDREGDMLITVDGEGSIMFWELPRNRVVALLEGQRDRGSAVRLTPDNHLAVLSASGAIAEWTLPRDRAPLAALEAEMQCKAPFQVNEEGLHLVETFPPDCSPAGAGHG